MEIVHVPGMNRELSPPADWDEAKHGPCGTLPVFAEVREGAMHMTSAWQPNATELAAMARGAPVAMTIIGGTHPPIVLGVFELSTTDHTKAPEEYSGWESRVWKRGYDMGFAQGTINSIPVQDETPEQRQKRLEEAVMQAARALQDDMHFGASYLPGENDMGVYIGTASSVASLASSNALRVAGAQCDAIIHGNKDIHDATAPD